MDIKTTVEPTIIQQNAVVMKSGDLQQDFKNNEENVQPLGCSQEKYDPGIVIKQEIIETFDIKIEPNATQNLSVKNHAVKVENIEEEPIIDIKPSVADNGPLVKQEIDWVKKEMCTESDEDSNMKMEKNCLGGEETSNAGGSESMCDIYGGDIHSFPQLENHMQACIGENTQKTEEVAVTSDLESLAGKVCRKCDCETCDCLVNRNQKQQGKNNLFSCTSCEFWTTHKSSLQRHTRIKHNSNQQIGHDWADTISSYDMKVHEKTPSEEKPYSCSQCKFKTSRKPNLKAHMITHISQRFSCTKCNYKTVTNLHLETHMKRKHTSGSFRCTKCNYMTRNEFYFKSHLKIHEEPYSCHVCGFQTLKSYELKEHKTKHVLSLPVITRTIAPKPV